MKYIYLKDRSEFRDLFYSKTESVNIDDCYLCERDRLDRIIGAFIVLDHESYLFHLELIDRKIIRRNDKVRNRADVPEFDKVKNLVRWINRRMYYLYHRTHLLPFRFCLNDGSLKNLLFTATARLNSGLRIEDQYVPEKFQINDNVEEILNEINHDRRYFEDLETTEFLSLADFERAASHILLRDKERLFKYGVECIYDEESRFVSEIKVFMINVTDKELVFLAKLKNQL